MIFRRCLIALFACCVSFSTPVLAEDEAESKPTQPGRVFEGGVKGTVLLFDEGCAKITLARELIQETTEKIMKEASRKDTVVVRGPNAIGNGIVIPAVGGVGGVMQMGEMPIRRDKLQRFLTQTDQSIAALQSYVDALQIPAGMATQLDPTYASMRATMDDVQTHLATLKELSAAKRLSNGKIAKEALKIYDAMTQLEKQRSQLLALANAGNAARDNATTPATSTTEATNSSDDKK